MPNSIWLPVLHEVNSAYLNFSVLLFIVLSNCCCMLGIYIGIRVKFVGRYPHKANDLYQGRKLKALYFPVIALIFLILIDIAYLFYSYPEFVFLSISGEGDAAKLLLMDDTIRFKTLVLYAIPVNIWAWMRYANSDGNYNGLRFLLLISTFLCVVLCVINASRAQLMPLFVGLFVIFAKNRLDKVEVSKHGLISLRYLMVFSFMLIAIFSVFAMTRGNTDIDQIVASILGYGPVSFNRLASILAGKMHYEYSPTMAYILGNGFSNIVFETENWQIWASEFSSTLQAGLNDNYIWGTMYGYLFDGLGFLSIIYFVLFGVFIGGVWKGFCRGSLFGLIFYPFLFFCLLFFLGQIISFLICHFILKL